METQFINLYVLLLYLKNENKSFIGSWATVPGYQNNHTIYPTIGTMAICAILLLYTLVN